MPSSDIGLKTDCELNLDNIIDILNGLIIEDLALYQKSN